MIKNALTDQEILDLLTESNVINSLSHFELNEFHTAITSKDELFTLVRLAFDAGVSSCYE